MKIYTNAKLLILAGREIAVGSAYFLGAAGIYAGLSAGSACRYAYERLIK